jgi:hypothetical protein
MAPTHLFTGWEWEELSQVILSRDQPWDAYKQDRELTVNEDHMAHPTKLMNGMIHIALSKRRIDDQGQDWRRNKYAMQKRITVHQPIYHMSQCRTLTVSCTRWTSPISLRMESGSTHYMVNKKLTPWVLWRTRIAKKNVNAETTT